MLRFVVAQARHRPGRTAALLLGILVATTSFAVLTGAAETSRLELRGTLAEQFRSSYDLLVRPRDSYTPLETEQGLVRPNYQSGIFGGITSAQLDAIRGLRGVDIAAPVANLGIVLVRAAVPVRVRMDPAGPDQQLFRITPRWSADRGLSLFTGAPRYVYVSRHRAVVVESDDGRGKTYAEVIPGRDQPLQVCGSYDADVLRAPPGTTSPAFPYAALRLPGLVFSGDRISCFYLPTTPPPMSIGQELVTGASDPADVRTTIEVTFPVLLAAVDADAEAALTGLDRAVTTGRWLTAADEPTQPPLTGLRLPTVAATSSGVDTSVSATVDRVTLPAGGATNLFADPQGVVDRVAALPGSRVGELPATPSSTAYDTEIGAPHGILVDNYWQAGAVTYARVGDALRPVPVTNDPGVFVTPLTQTGGPAGSDDVAFRTLVARQARTSGATVTTVGLSIVGRFDPARVVRDASLSGVASELFVPPELPGADAASRAALGDRPLAPDTNLGGYLSQPPLLLTTLKAAAPLLRPTLFAGADPSAPISVVRVRVAGITGPDPMSRERLNQAALAITEATGLAVDIVAGAAGIPETVVLPAGNHGRPELRLVENWARKGVAYTIVESVDRKSVALFALILAVCALVVSNAAAAAVRARRVELGVLAALGWGRGRIFGSILAELALVGLVAGLLGASLALPIAAATGLTTSPAQALLAVPAAVLLAVLAGLGPARAATTASPLDAVRPRGRRPRRSRGVRGVLGMTLARVVRVPGRSLLGALALAVGVAAIAVLVAVQQAFGGQVVGTLLGDAVSVQVRGADVAAVIAICALAALGVADVLYLTVREQAAELAALTATGWPRWALRCLVLGHGVVVGLLGGVVGALVGGWAVGRLAGSLDPVLLPVIGYAAVSGLLIAVVGSLVPALVVDRLPLARLLSQEDG